MAANPPTSVFPGLLGDNIGLYRNRPENFLASFLAHLMAVALILWLAAWITDHPSDHGLKLGHGISIGPISFSPDPSGHGSGGTHDLLPASRGALPTLTLEQQLTPPEAVPLNSDPKLPEPPSVMALSTVKSPSWRNWVILCQGFGDLPRMVREVEVESAPIAVEAWVRAMGRALDRTTRGHIPSWCWRRHSAAPDL